MKADVAPECFTEADFEFVASATPVEVVQEMDRSDTNDSIEEAHNIMLGAGIMGCILGCIVCGPAMACIAGIGSAYGTTRESPAGDAARSMGRLAITCGTKATELNETHHITDKAKTAACSCIQTTKNLVEEHRVVEKTSTCLSNCWVSVKKMNDDHHIVERSLKGLSSTLDMVNDKVMGSAPTNQAAAASSPVQQVMNGEVVRDRGAAVRGGYMAVANNNPDEN